MTVSVLLAALGAWMSMSAAPDIFSPEAQWVRDPRAVGHPVMDHYKREREKPSDPKGPQNLHTLLRREFTLDELPAGARLIFTADDYALVFLNGEKVFQGPESGYPFAHPCLEADAAPFLRTGVNVLAVHLYYQGLRNRVWDSGDNRSGLRIQLDLMDGAGAVSQRIVSDDSWKCLPLEAFPTGETIGYKTQFLEDIDMRLYPAQWREAGFDDRAWEAPVIDPQDHVFIRQLTPPLEIRNIAPLTAEALPKGKWFFDFGAEIVGHTRIRLKGERGHRVVVRHGEELSGPREVRFEMRASSKYEETVTLSGGEDLVEFFDYRGFRYMELLDVPGTPEVWVEVRHHPFDPSRAAFECGDRELEQVWDICRNGVVMGSQGGFLDCPTREKGQYLGDAVITARSHFWLTADPTLTRKALHDFALSQRICPGMMAVAPGSFMQEITEYSLQFPLMLLQYYKNTGDEAFTRDLMVRSYAPLFDYFQRFENADGLVEGVTRPREKWVLIDWPAEMRDDFDYDYGADKANAVVNGFYYGALRAAAELSRLLGMDTADYDRRADRVAAGFAARLVDPSTGLYLDAPGSKHSSLHANAVPLAFGLHAGADQSAMLDFIRQKRLACGVYMAPYVIEACFNNGAPELGYELLASYDKRSWREMLRHGATACLEAWSPNDKKNMSWCHPWSSSPLFLWPERVAGLSPAEPGWKRIRIAPPALAGLPEFFIKAPLPDGRTVTVRHFPERGYLMDLPAGLPHESEGDKVSCRTRRSLGPVQPEPELDRLLAQCGWAERVGEGTGILVSAPLQRLWLITAGTPVWTADCSTAKAGVGSLEGSGMTPSGWHQIAEKFGEGAPWGRIFQSRAATARRWLPGDATEEDLVLTRILWLEGKEPGLNCGKDTQGRSIDSKGRHIYIHGTNGEELIGTPASHGCIRLLNDDVLDLFPRVDTGTPVFIAGE